MSTFAIRSLILQLDRCNVGVGEAVLYRHFPTKRGLAGAIFGAAGPVPDWAWTRDRQKPTTHKGNEL